MEGLSSKHKQYLQWKTNRRRYNAVAVLQQQGDTGALWLCAATTTFTIAIILLMTSCPIRAGINYCGPAFTEYQGTLTSKKIDHCGNDDYHCDPFLTYSYSGNANYDKFGNYTSYSGGKSCVIEGVTTETNVGTKHLKSVWGLPIGSKAIIYASATNLCHLQKPMTDMFAASIAMWILFFFSFLQCCAVLTTVPPPESAVSHVADDTAKAEEFFGAYRTSRNAGLRYSYSIRKSDETDYVFAHQRRKAYINSQTVRCVSAYSPFMYASVVGVTPFSAEIKALLDAEVGQICARANEKRARLARAVAACPNLTLIERIRGWFQASSGGAKALAFFPLLALSPLIVIADAVSAIFFGRSRLEARSQWFEDVFSKNPDLDTFSIDDCVAAEMRALSERVGGLCLADAEAGAGTGAGEGGGEGGEQGLETLYVGFTTETDDDRIASRDGGGSTGWIAHSYIMWDTFKINFYSSKEALEQAVRADAEVDEGEGEAEGEKKKVGVAVVVEGEAVPATLSDATKVKAYGTYMLSFVSSGSNYLLVSEGGSSSNKGVDIYQVTSTAIAKVKTHSGLVDATSKYYGFAHDGTNLFVLGDSASYKVFSYTLSSLLSSTISTPSTSFTLASSAYIPSVAATYVSTTTTGYVAVKGYGSVAVCAYSSTSTTSCTAKSWTLTSGSSTYFGYYIAFAPTTSKLAVGDTGWGSDASFIYLYDVSSASQPSPLATYISTSSNSRLGYFFSLSSTALFASAGSDLYSFKIDGTTTPTAKLKDSSFSASVLSTDGATLVMASSSKAQTFDVYSDGKLSRKSKFDISGYDALASTPDFVFSSSKSYGSGDGQVQVTANTRGIVVDGGAYYWMNKYLSTTCAGSPFAWEAHQVVPFSAAFAGLYLKTCFAIGDFSAIGEASGSAPETPSASGGAVLTKTYYTASDCAAGTNWVDERQLYIGLCSPISGSDKFLLISSCSSSSVTLATYSDSKCSAQVSTETSPLTTSCTSTPDSEGNFAVDLCIPAPANSKPSNALAIGLGVGLGGGAVLAAGAGALYYYKTLSSAAQKVYAAPVAEPEPPAAIELQKTDQLA